MKMSGRQASTSSPTTPRAQLAGARARFRGRASTMADRHGDDGRNHADRRTRRPAEIAGEPEHHAPAHAMRRRTASITLMSAPDALAITTPVSSRRAVPPLRARKSTTATAVSAPATSAELDRRNGSALRISREQCADGQRRPRRRARRDPPAGFGRAPGAARLATASSPPTPNAASKRGRRTSSSTLRAVSSPAPASAASAPRRVIPDVPINSAAAKTATASDSSAMRRRVEPGPNQTARDIEAALTGPLTSCGRLLRES